MADVSSEGKRDFKQPSEASPSTNIRPDVGQNPNTQIGPYGQFEHTAFDASYDHTPFTSVNPSGPSGGSKFVHPFMMERFTDDSGDTRLRIYGGKFFHTITTIIFARATYDNNHTLQVSSQDAIAGIKEEPVAGFSAIQDDDGNDTVLTSIEYPANESYGDFFVKWSPTVSKTEAFGVVFGNNNVVIHRVANIGSVQNDAEISNLEAININSGSAQLRRGDGTGSDHAGTYYAKIGTSYDPSVAGTNSKTIEQVLFNHVYWSPMIVAESE